MAAFEGCVRSVLEQTFDNWEWCLVDDAGHASQYDGILADLAKSDGRIRIFKRHANGGIIAASNDAASLASGDFLCLLDHDDELAPSALQDVHEVLSRDDEIDYVYTDEDKIDSAGRHYDTFLKPTWSPERLRGQNYCCHLSVIRREGDLKPLVWVATHNPVVEEASALILEKGNWPEVESVLNCCHEPPSHLNRPFSAPPTQRFPW
ncbi:MAG: glycosyltransferase [Bacteroidetes bacterium]|nr:glycosyltransferase [Bacteroidota bacterium]